MSLLEELNLKPNFIYETIVTTYTDQGVPNAAPMGIVVEDEQTVVISPFTSTQTFANIRKTGYAVINFIYDLQTIFNSLYSTSSPKLPIEDFEEGVEVGAPRLKAGLAYIELQVKEIQIHSNRARIIGEIIAWSLKTCPLFPLNRGFSLTLECLVHSTRILEFQDAPHKIKPLIDLVKQYRKLVEKVAPNGDYIGIIEQIQDMLENKGLWD